VATIKWHPHLVGDLGLKLQGMMAFRCFRETASTFDPFPFLNGVPDTKGGICRSRPTTY
jgi:hypothetical protein